MKDTTIYTDTFAHARENGELEAFRGNWRQNTACAAAIDAALKADHRDMPGALAAVREQVGLDRPAWLLAGYLREQGWDGRYSQTNVEWAKGFDAPPEQSSRVALKPHPVYLNELVDATRAELTTRERHADYDLAEKLPPVGHPCEHGYSSKFAEKLLDSMEDTRQCTLCSAPMKRISSATTLFIPATRLRLDCSPTRGRLLGSEWITAAVCLPTLPTG